MRDIHLNRVNMSPFIMANRFGPVRSSIVARPVVTGEEEQGSQLPLRARVL